LGSRRLAILGESLDPLAFTLADETCWQATGDREWYDPKAITTSGGSLAITFTADPENGMNFTSGMLQGWNKFCFTGGLIEAKVMMPGWSNLMGMWPAIWTMGNLGRAGYGATTHGMVCVSADNRSCRSYIPLS
jgi:beta-glucanase (GH16 family)